MDAVVVALAAVALALGSAAAAVTLALLQGRKSSATASSPLLVGPAPPSLEGERVVAHTPRPDEQSVRGVVIREQRRPDGTRELWLADAVYLTATPDGGVEELQGGEVLVERVSTVQLLARP